MQKKKKGDKHEQHKCSKTDKKYKLMSGVRMKS